MKRFGIHQRVDKVAYRLILSMIKPSTFPSIRQIINFEGMNGPDGLKVKSPGDNEPSHLYNPDNDKGEVPIHINNHYKLLVKSLKNNDKIRAGFEAAWLAHYITDGLTPAHHTMENELMELDNKSFKIISKILENPEKLESNTKFIKLKKRWGLWGSSGIMTKHFYFELCVAATILASRTSVEFDWSKYTFAKRKNILALFRKEAKKIARLDLYNYFKKNGWNNKVAKIIKNQIIPETIIVVATSWLLAYEEAGLVKIKK